MKATVTFTRYYIYEVEIEEDVEDYEADPERCEEEIFDKAYDLFSQECRYPVADLSYNEVEIEVE